jgi:sec-independent protein translocase protein TatB
MFDIGASELLLIAIVAIVAIGPKDLPLALRTAGRWLGKVRQVSGHFRSGIETMIREAELEEMEAKWREQNAAILQANPLSASAEAALVGQDPGTPAPVIEPIAEPESTEPAPAKPKRARKKAD